MCCYNFVRTSFKLGGGLKCAEGNGKDGGVWDNLPWENGALIWNQIKKFRQQKYSR